MAGIVFSKSSGVNDSIFGKSQYPIRALIEEKVEAFEKDRSMVNKVFNVEKTNKFAEQFDYETQLGNFEAVGEGGAYPTTEMRGGYSKVIEPDTWKNQFEVTMEMIEDAHMGKVKRRASAFTLSYNRTRELFGAGMLASGESTTATLFGKVHSTATADDVALFSTAHTSVTGGSNQSNLFAEAFGHDALCLAQEHMQNLTDDDGNILGLSPDTIIIPNIAGLITSVMNVVGAESGEPGTAVHGMNRQYGLWNVLIWPYLNQYITPSDQPWIILDSEYNKAYGGAIWLDRVGLSVRSEIAENDNNVWKGRARFMAGFNDWRPFALSYSGSGGTDLG